ncbi:hypothetical protein [Tomitella fengzijianii]|uniref:Uncharacterized protein n=1 Tax=Tomitella fengzijianii TaxID=2597660 RepID=A0A516X7D7_9ACTN|nr:hypothetical protein [Tomitella fengzijianii]QDQ98988.1 hypothetical protein FO059_03190 [Tomitella fengzijianii]
MDDYPVHQISEVVRHVGTSDRNFYDRYYFNCAPRFDGQGQSGVDGPFALIIGLGQYPNLGVADAFAVLRRGDDHLVVRASKALGEDRMDTSVGPFRLEVIEGLRRLRVVLEASPDNPDLSFDLTFTADSPAHLEARHFDRSLERVTFDTQRFVQSGTWSGSVTVEQVRTPVEDHQWSGNRDRSWGVRPVGEPEPPGRRADPAETERSCFFWIYAVLRFSEFVIITILQEDADGARIVEDAVRLWRDPERAPETLALPEHTLRFAPGGREVTHAELVFQRRDPSGGLADPLRVECTPAVACYIGVGTGYGLEQDWRHGMWQGPLTVQQLRRAVPEIAPWERMLCPVDNLVRCTLSEDGGIEEGEGLFECAVIGTYPRYGFHGLGDVAE